MRTIGRIILNSNGLELLNITLNVHLSFDSYIYYDIHVVIMSRHPTDWWCSPRTPVSTVKKSDRHNINEILSKTVLNIYNNSSKPVLIMNNRCAHQDCFFSEHRIFRLKDTLLYCLIVFDWWLLISSFVSSNFSHKCIWGHL